MNNFHHRLQVRFSEVDMHQHVYFASYFIYYEIAITEFLKNIGFNPKLPGSLAIYVRHVESDYYRPIFFDQIINIGVTILKIGESSLTFELPIFTEDYSEKCASGKLVWICVDTHTGKKASWPAELNTLLSSSNK
jgi:acyl-CoA thioester hydrolase